MVSSIECMVSTEKERKKKNPPSVCLGFGVRENEIYFAVFRFAQWLSCVWRCALSQFSGCVRASPLSDKQICSTFHNLYIYVECVSATFYMVSCVYSAFSCGHIFDGFICSIVTSFLTRIFFPCSVSFYTINTCQ